MRADPFRAVAAMDGLALQLEVITAATRIYCS